MPGPAGLTAHAAPEPTQAPTVGHPAAPARGRHAAGPPTVTVPDQTASTETDPTSRPRRGRHAADLATTVRAAAFTSTQGHTHVPDPYDGPVTWEQPQAPATPEPAPVPDGARPVVRRARVRLAPTPVARTAPVAPARTTPTDGEEPSLSGPSAQPAQVPSQPAQALPPDEPREGTGGGPHPAAPTAHDDAPAPASAPTPAGPDVAADLTLAVASAVAASQPVPPFGRQTYATPYGPSAVSSPTLGTDPLARPSRLLARRLALPVTAAGLLLALGVGLGYALGAGIL